MMKNAIWIGLTLSLLGLVSASNARADEWNKKTVLTFSQPVEIPGHVLPAGTYVFKLADTKGDRHIVQIFNADETRVIATVMTIPDYRLTTTEETVIKFSEVPRGSPEAIRAWFYPGNSLGQEFVYPKGRAEQLAAASKVVVPAIATDVPKVADVNALKTASIVAVTPEAKVMPVTAAIRTTPVERVENVAPVRQIARNTETARQLPKTASTLPLIVLLGLASIGAAFGLGAFGRYVTAPRR